MPKQFFEILQKLFFSQFKNPFLNNFKFLCISYALIYLPQ